MCVFVVAECEGDQFQCVSSGECIEIVQRCDGNEDCPDASDEENCAGKNFEMRLGTATRDDFEIISHPNKLLFFTVQSLA